jgi:antitoxin component YwqK of YwqJK toxin-antitoxin module
MKTFLSLLLVLAVSCLTAQKLNDHGLYVEDDGSLFSGNVTSMQSEIRSIFAVKTGVIDGPAQYFTSNGKLLESGYYKNGQKHDKWIRYTSTGNISAIAFYKLGKKHGTWLVYDDNGRKRFELNYENGNKTGMWTSWNEEGLVTGTKDYSKLN